MCFKGGTSLSKVFRLIHRFSEDIDISLDRAAIGFTGKRDMANEALSNTKRKQIDKQLREVTENEVTTKILPRLTESFASVIGKNGWSLQASPEAGEEMTLLFSYPNAFEYTA
jgi:predicted nucleotidyltransferase component of viral defense system